MTSPITQELEELEKEFGTAAIQLIVTFVAIFVVAFLFGYWTGIN